MTNSISCLFGRLVGKGGSKMKTCLIAHAKRTRVVLLTEGNTFETLFTVSRILRITQCSKTSRHIHAS